MTPVSVMKQFANCYCEKLTNILNNCLKENRLPNLMKVAEISPVFKKFFFSINQQYLKDNYQPTSTLSFAKLFESIIYSQLNDCIENKFSKYLTAFHKNRNT